MDPTSLCGLAKTRRLPHPFRPFRACWFPKKPTNLKIQVRRDDRRPCSGKAFSDDLAHRGSKVLTLPEGSARPHSPKRIVRSHSPRKKCEISLSSKEARYLTLPEGSARFHTPKGSVRFHSPRRKGGYSGLRSSRGLPIAVSNTSEEASNRQLTLRLRK